jgi:hypothetical protein
MTILSLPGDPVTYEAIGTVGAFTIALVVYVGSTRDRRREQASRVSAWVEAVAGSTGDVALKLLNGSDQPVHDLYVTPTGSRRSEAEPYVPAILPPGTQSIPTDPGVVAATGYDLPAPVDLVFADAFGRQWHRLGRRHDLRRCRPWHRHPWQVRSWGGRNWRDSAE